MVCKHYVNTISLTLKCIDIKSVGKSDSLDLYGVTLYIEIE